MKILIVSGFLGAGKTTFIKELIKHTKKQIVVLENEYGEVNLDAKEIRTNSGMKVYEFSDGCVCCTMKDGFVSSLMTISATLDPEILIVEPTGIGKLGSIMNIVRGYEYERIKLLKPVVIVSPDSFAQYRAQYPDIYLDQIENADKVIFSKCEQTDGAILNEMASVIAEISPDASVIPQHYSRNPQEWWDDLLVSETEKQAAEEEESLFPVKAPSEITVNGTLAHPGQLVLLLHAVIHGAYGDIIRAKGILKCGDMWLRFDVADGRYAITGADESDISDSAAVFIGSDIKESKLNEIFGIKPKISLVGRMRK